MAFSSTVKFFNETKGFGFINHEGDSLFMHRTDIVSGNPGDGDTVTFDVGTDERSGKTKASNIVVEGGGTGKGPSKGFGKGGFGGGGGDRSCYNCGGEGHISSDCPEPRKAKGKGKGGGGGGGFSGECYNCGGEGHQSRDCPEPRKGKGKGKDKGGGFGGYGGDDGGQQVCRQFQRGECTRGDACRFSH